MDSKNNRGVINHRERARQINDFRNLLYGSITPTDIDGCIEYQNKAYILIEIKYNDAQMPRGQELAFTRMCDDFTRAGKMAILILAEHYVDDWEKDVDVAMCIVRKYYFKFKWYDNFNGTVKNLTDRFIQSVNKSR